MGWSHHWIGFAAFLIWTFSLSLGQEDAPKPTFPDVFQAEVEGIFIGELMKLDGTIYYDRKNNRAALFYTFEKQEVKTFYNFDDNEVVSFQGNECEVSEIPSESADSLFSFTTDKMTGKKNIDPPEDLLYFTKSTFLNKGIYLGLPTYVYEANVDLTMYRRNNCTVRHIFTRQEVEQPDCDSHDCQSTLLTVYVSCPSYIKEETEDEEGGNVEGLEQYFNFHRFKYGIYDVGVFQPPAGIFCSLTNHKEFPGLPDYFSFSYDFQENMRDYLTNPGVVSTHKKVWYDSKLRLIRVDEFEDNGLLISSRIFDFNRGTAYTIVTHIAECEKGVIKDVVDLSELTRLPKLFFEKNLTAGDAVYIGKRKAHGLSYDVWSASVRDTEADSFHVQEFFFKTITSNTGGKGKLQISHADIYMYGRNPETQSFEMSVNAYYSVNNFRTMPKEWEAFDVSACFDHDQRKIFRLKVAGPTVVKNSLQYEDLLERLYMQLTNSTSVSVIRISELAGVYDGIHLTEFNGWILDKPTFAGSQANSAEPDMNSVYEQLKVAAATGRLDMEFKREKEEVQYKFTLIEELAGSDGKSSWAIAAIVLTTVVGVFVVGSVIYYVLRKKKFETNPFVPMGHVI